MFHGYVGIVAAAAAVLAALSPVPAWALSGVEEAPAGSIAQEDDWLVVQQAAPQGCYLTGVAQEGGANMRLIVAGDRIPVLKTPYDRGFKGYVVLTVDRRPPLYIASFLVDDPQSFALPEAIHRDLIRGRKLIVKAQPVGVEPLEQAFSLIGFTRALEWLDRTECRVQEATFPSNAHR
ncbi:MAG: hypothetical protein OEM59_04330 [Rhodospirillales bacterium]|nr:hypothetical protein [Rhodospirillales bacterium]